MDDVTDSVKEYYGKVLQGTKDLKTSACCSTESIPARHKKILGNIEDEIMMRFYGCGSPIPSAIQGTTIVDLGCGTGRDVYLASALVGEEGLVIGVDMTDEQLDVAKKYEDAQMKRFGFSKSNVVFKKGYMENLKAVGVEDDSADLVISNCVVNLSPNKPEVLAEIFRALKPGGELYFSDVFSNRRVPQHLREDETLYGECLSGALYTEDFRRTLYDLGCKDYRVVSSRVIEIEDDELREKCGNITFTSQTIRAFKMDLEDRCEDYGQFAIYDGGIEENPNAFLLDDHHLFETGKPMLVCGNTADMLSKSRYGKHFQVVGNKERHFGIFDCGPDELIEDGASCC